MIGPRKGVDHALGNQHRVRTANRLRPRRAHRRTARRPGRRGLRHLPKDRLQVARTLRRPTTPPRPIPQAASLARTHQRRTGDRGSGGPRAVRLGAAQDHRLPQEPRPARAAGPHHRPPPPPPPPPPPAPPPPPPPPPPHPTRSNASNGPNPISSGNWTSRATSRSTAGASTR